ncbi:alpha/beta hydrolase [Pilimelia terevasa]|uniref:Alpha/beta hydrolase n=1 Tax=Pilimelia terevasa TaxID=53372 RepID=A0A8J3BR59_9ACTN|nr:alpha/beta hydrolase [Pilimelia terevasa]
MEMDLLGPPYEKTTITLPPDDEGPVVATLVRRRAARPTTRAVLYVHGFVDYFFQTHLADYYADRGWDFYALDLRKYGRSLLPHQTPNFCRSLTEYRPELDAAARLIRDDDGHDRLLLLGHSTGGLIGALWAHARRAERIVDGLVLNSPFFDFQAPWLLRRPVLGALAGVGRARPGQVFLPGLTPHYGESIHASRRGTWAYDLAWKPLRGFPIRAGWLGAIRAGQRRLRAGLAIDVPVLLTMSDRSYLGSRWHDDVTSSDAVLNVAHMARWAPQLGRHVTLVRIAGGLHDLTLSAPPVQAEVFAEWGRWLGAYLEA